MVFHWELEVMQYCNLIDKLEKKFHLKNVSQVADEIINTLDYLEYNLLDINYLSEGESSIVFEYNNKVIKICFINYGKYKLQDYVSYSSSIAPVLYEKKIDINEFYNLSIIVNKKYNTSNIKKRDVFIMYSILRNDGYLWNDTKTNNIGKDENGKLFLFDYGELINLNLIDNKEYDFQMKHHIIQKKEYNEFYNKMLAGYYDKYRIKDFFRDLFNKKK